MLGPRMVKQKREKKVSKTEKEERKEKEGASPPVLKNEKRNPSYLNPHPAPVNPLHSSLSDVFKTIK